MRLAGVFKCYFFHLRQIIVISILSLHIINEPTLVGKPVFEMIHSQWQCVELRLYGCKESSVRSFLETDELHEVYSFSIYSFIDFRKLQHIRIGKVGFDGMRRVYGLPDIAEKHFVHLW